MRSRTFKLVGPVLVVAVLGTVLWVNAGDLNPPAGAPGSTMRTLGELGSGVDTLQTTVDEIQPKVDEIHTIVSSPSSSGETTWEYAFHTIQPGEEVQVASGAGVVHGIWVLGTIGAGAAYLYDGSVAEGTPMGVFWNQILLQESGPRKSEFFQLDVRFSSALTVHVLSSHWPTYVTVLYRPTS